MQWPVWSVVVQAKSLVARAIDSTEPEQGEEIFREGGREKRINIDIDGYKRRREDKISRLIRETARKVRKSKKPISLDPMSASERRMAYIALKREGGVGYETKEDRDQKRIIITPHHSRG